MHAATLISTFVAIATFVAANPIERRNSDINKCWQNPNSGTDGGVSMPSVCTKADDKDFPSYGSISSGSNGPLTTTSHVTLGPWHCCATCVNDATCAAWFMDDYCNCVLYHDSGCSAGTPTFALSSPVSGNSTLTFHAGGCKSKSS